MVRRHGRRLVAAALLLGLSQLPDVRAQSAAGDFDFYVLSLSWSPSYCEAEGRETGRQCGAWSDFGFIVHGLWPQYERGYPEFCRTPHPQRVPEEVGSAYFDIMPDMGLIGHQWRKHGSCTGLSPAAYLETTRQAFEAVVIPKELRNVETERQIDPSAVEQQFRATNPGLPADGIAVTCSGGRLDEVRICLSERLDFRSCAEVDANSCRRKAVTLPPQ